jgi:hypothetical protein
MINMTFFVMRPPYLVTLPDGISVQILNSVNAIRLTKIEVGFQPFYHPHVIATAFSRLRFKSTHRSATERQSGSKKPSDFP